ncbi:hypothetical protein RFI_37836 [Reticulomyxa filosa]|uniref:Uncharacterized protein n=1 Tax=Reticulomyxa filosa TaxID=46433 RepID=X6LFW4_RETFI|nr:hypothetical protein RFI_37836 [Reticulomyxa filosa]|eukprot:ETN99634.1 hypothetical protein RFI_37836 [Reticulomyxa filosa]
MENFDASNPQKKKKKKEIEQARSCDLQSFDEERFNIFVEELDLLKMFTCGESSKHNNCVQISLSANPLLRINTKYNFRIEPLDDYASFVKLLQTFQKFNDQLKEEQYTPTQQSHYSHTHTNSQSLESISQFSFCTSII